jgi:AraC-like DNA-binding protein
MAMPPSQDKSRNDKILMSSIKAHRIKPTELAWLLNVVETRQPLTEQNPIWVKKATEPVGSPILYERHPYCEISITVESKSVSLVEDEEALRLPGDLELVGPGIPHTSRILSQPQKYIAVYFLPSLLIEMGPTEDGVRALRRFTCKQTQATRLIRPPPRMIPGLTSLFEQMVSEFEARKFGREIRLRSLFGELIVSILRWEESTGLSLRDEVPEIDWKAISKALHYLRESYSQPVYAEELAKASGVSAARLRILFKAATGLSWMKFLQGYRIHRALALLSEPGRNVTEVALAAGFDSLSHFNATFHSFMGVSPRHYLKKPEPDRLKR